jgi:hypothetical protein
MPEIEGSLLDFWRYYGVALRAAVGTTSVNSVTAHTADTPNREPVMDWLHTLVKAWITEQALERNTSSKKASGAYSSAFASLFAPTPVVALDANAPATTPE